MFGVAPYNPILGETHHASRGNLNVLLEQVLYIYFLDHYHYIKSSYDNGLG